MLNIAFFSEAGSTRGYGHLIRSYTIFQEFQNHNATFFLDSDINFDAKFDNLHYFQWKDLHLQKQYDIILIDSYEADSEVYTMLRCHTKVLLCIDDFRRIEYPKSIIINFAPDAKTLFYPEEKPNYHYLLGLDYIPIRKEFSKINVKQKEQIFIMLGGSDTANLSLDIIKHLQDVNRDKIVVHNDITAVQELQKFDGVKVLHKPNDETLTKAMKESSFAIITAGMSAYELAYLQIPSIVIPVAKNQDISALKKHNIATFALHLEDKDFFEKLKEYLGQKEFQITQKIDGFGAHRIYKKAMELL